MGFLSYDQWSDWDIVLLNKYNITECLASMLRELIEYREASTQMYLK